MYWSLGVLVLSIGAHTLDLSVDFSPYDGQARLTREVELVKTVMESRQHFHDQSDDWEVKYAVYGLLDATYIKPLIAAAHVGVKVQVLLEHRQLAHSYVTVWKNFSEAGLNVTSTHRTQRNLTDDERKNMNLIGMDVGGLFHLKTRYFRWRDIETEEMHEAVITGSLNPEDVSWQFNCETYMEIHDQHAIDRYNTIYHAALYDKPVVNAWSEGAPAQVLYSKGSGVMPVEILFDLIKKEEKAILLPMFILKDVVDKSGDRLSEALCAAKRRGVYVAGAIAKDLVDGPKINDPTALPLRLWKACEIPIYKTMVYGAKFVALHEKNAVFVSLNTVVTDTTNWSSSGLGWKGASPANGETMLIVRDPAKLTTLRFISNFFYVMRRFEYQQACPYLQNETEIRENCHENEPFNQPDWSFLPSADEILSRVDLNLNVSWHFEATSSSPVTNAECSASGTTWKPELYRHGNTIQSSPVQVPFLARVTCSLSSASDAAVSFVHVADPATQWAIGQDGSISSGRADDESLQRMESVAKVNMQTPKDTLLV